MNGYICIKQVYATLLHPQYPKPMLVLEEKNDSPSRVMLRYTGSITSDQISDILERVEGQFGQIKASPQVKKKIMGVLIESIQNVFHHGAKGQSPSPAHDSSVLVAEQNGDYIVVTGNRIPTEKAMQLADRLERINSMTREELNNNYRNILLQKLKSSAFGAGVGMIDIARRSGSKIQYKLEKIDESFHFFSMEVKIAR